MQKVLITGAGSGFGLLTAVHLLKKGYFVIATMRDISKRNQLEEIAHKFSLEKNLMTLKLDITDSMEIYRVKENLVNSFEGIDILINNAGYAQGGFFEELSMEDWNSQFKTNLFGHIQVTKALLPLIKKNRSGKIINISSISGYFGFPGLSPYTASKHALEGWSESLRLELISENIWVSLVEPASYQTGIWEKGLKKIHLDGNRPRFQANIIKQVEIKGENSGDPEAVAALITHICQAKRPKLRYPIGSGTKLMLMFKNILPWSIIEGLVVKKLSKPISK